MMDYSELAHLLAASLEEGNSPYAGESAPHASDIVGWMRADLLRPLDSPSVPAVLERLVEVFFIPSTLVKTQHRGMPIVMSWHGLLREPSAMFEDIVLGDVWELAKNIHTAGMPTSGTATVETPAGPATLTFRRTTRWEYTLSDAAGTPLGFPEQLCIMTQYHAPGAAAYPVPIHDMLREPRDFQLRPFEVRGNLDLSGGRLWWPHN